MPSFPALASRIDSYTRRNNARFLDAYATAVLADSPVSYWRLGEASGVTAADYQGAHAGTYVASPSLGVAGRVTGNTAVTFTAASSQYVDTGDLSLFDTGDCTYECWFKTTTAATQALVGETRVGSDLAYAYLRVQSTGVVFASFANDTTSGNDVVGTTNVLTGQWFHAALTKTGTTVRLYVNGAAEGTAQTAAGAYTLTGSTIGALRRASNLQFFTGTIDEVAVYNTALSAARISAHYTAAG